VKIGECISDSGFCYINDLVIPFKENDIQIILPFQPHYDISVQNSTNTLWYFSSFEPLKVSTDNLCLNAHHIIDLLKHITISGIFNSDTYPILSNLVNDIINESLLNNKFKQNMITTKIYMLLMELAQISSRNNGKIGNLTINNVQIDLILSSITAVSKTISQGCLFYVTEMATSCNLSESYFRKIFTKIIGESPKKHLDRCYLNHALQLLFETDKSISDIILEIDIEDPSTYYCEFTKLYKLSPLKYRKQNIEIAK